MHYTGCVRASFRFLVVVLLSLQTTLAQDDISFPLKHSDNHQYLVDSRNKPVFLNGCSPWALNHRLTLEEARRYLQDRKAKGFNALLFQITPSNAGLLKNEDEENLKLHGDLPNIYNEYVFNNRDLLKPNESYFKHVDSILALCEEMNFAVLLVPLYQGCCEDGWKEILDKDSESLYKAHHYGKWVANRYKHLPNIIWVSGGDHAVTPQTLAFAEGIAAVDTGHLHTFHGDPGYSSQDALPNAKWLTLDMIYTYFPALSSSRATQQHIYSLFFREWSKGIQMPVFMGESAYEYERDENTQAIRRQAYWSVLSGGSGHFFGQRDIWAFGENWMQGLNTPGIHSMEIFGKFVADITWYNMIPDWTEMVFVSGRGYFNGGTHPGGNNYATAALSADKNLGVIYIPDYRVVGVNMEKFAGEVSAKWFDPSSGTYTSIKSTFLNKGIQYFTPPKRNNQQGFEDWVLIIKRK